jgi:hypothetical protein
LKTLLQLAATFALISIVAGVAVLTVGGYKIEKQALTALEHADGVLSKAEGEWQNEKADVHSILSRARDASDQAALFAAEQRLQLQKTSRDSDNQVRSLGLVTRNAEQFFYNLDQQLNGHVLPDFDRELIATSTAAQFSFESVTHAGDALTFQINDPAIPQMLESFNRAAQSLSVASSNGASILSHGDHVAAYYDKKLTTPLGFWRTLGKTALELGSQAGSISAGFVK